MQETTRTFYKVVETTGRRGLSDARNTLIRFPLVDKKITSHCGHCEIFPHHHHHVEQLRHLAFAHPNPTHPTHACTSAGVALIRGNWRMGFPFPPSLFCLLDTQLWCWWWGWEKGVSANGGIGLSLLSNLARPCKGSSSVISKCCLTLNVLLAYFHVAFT